MILPENAMRQHLAHEKARLWQEIATAVTPATIKAMAQIPRELFVDPIQRFDAYQNISLSVPGLEGNSSLSQPSVVATMVDLLNISSDNTVLEIGAGTGYQAAIMSLLARRVIGVEVIPALAQLAQQRLKALHLNNVDIIQADGSIPNLKPKSVDRLIVTASVVPSQKLPFLELLTNGGIAVMPVGGVLGEYGWCDLIRLRRQESTFCLEASYPNYFFVPMEGQNGWTHFYQTVTDDARRHFYNRLGVSDELLDKQEAEARAISPRQPSDYNLEGI